MRISVQAIPVNEVMKGIADQWRVPLKEENGEMKLELPETLGEGSIWGMSFGSGLGIVVYDCMFYHNHEILFSIKRTHPLKFIFSTVGSVNHSFEEENDLHEIKTYQNVIVSSSGTHGHLLSFKAGEVNKIVSIEIIRSEFSKRKNHDFSDLEPVLRNVFSDSTAVEKFIYHGNYSLKAADVVKEIAINQYTGVVRSFFIEGKLLQMLVLQIKQYQDEHCEDSSPQMLRAYDAERVKKATEMIKDQLSRNLSVEVLANEVGTNVNKLQDGFKQMYGLTVNKYAQEVKLKAARELLQEKELNISQVVTSVGLNNVSYFVKIFKEKYGMTPGFFQKHS